jgi:hypothetical protein
MCFPLFSDRKITCRPFLFFFTVCQSRLFRKFVLFGHYPTKIINLWSASGWTFDGDMLSIECSKDMMKLPRSTNLTCNITPFIFALALRTWLMKPFSRRNMALEDRVFNYRLSRARRVVENAFVILVNRFQCLLTTLKQEPHNVGSIIFACVSPRFRVDDCILCIIYCILILSWIVVSRTFIPHLRIFYLSM